MKAEELARYDGLGLAELVCRREVSAAELLDASIARVEALNPEINVVVTRLYDQARAAIAAGLPAGPFTGVPYLLKDLGAHYAGAVTSYGVLSSKTPWWTTTARSPRGTSAPASSSSRRPSLGRAAARRPWVDEEAVDEARREHGREHLRRPSP